MTDPWHMLSPEERSLADMLDRYAAEELAPLAAETDESAAFVRPQLQGLAELGLLGANLPEADGGRGVAGFDLSFLHRPPRGPTGSGSDPLGFL